MSTNGIPTDEFRYKVPMEMKRLIVLVNLEIINRNRHITFDNRICLKYRIGQPEHCHDHQRVQSHNMRLASSLLATDGKILHSLHPIQPKSELHCSIETIGFAA